MNHSFIPSKLNITVCATCKRDMIAHLFSATCESCGKPDINVNSEGEEKSALELTNNILLCRECFSRELEAVSAGPERTVKSIPVPEPIQRIESERFDRPSSQIERIARSALADLPQNGNEFFNAEVLSHLELEVKINNDSAIPSNEKFFFFTQQLQFRQQHLAKVLLDIKDVWLETKNRAAAVHQDLQILAGRLRKEEREKLKIQDVTYVDRAPSKLVKVPRMSAEDRVIEGIAKLLFAPKKDGIVQWEALTAAERQNLMAQARNVYKGTKKEMSDLNAAGPKG